jgi:hypothetical protein
MGSCRQRLRLGATVDLDAAAEEAVTACGGDAREAGKALLVANDFLETELAKLRGKVSKGYARGRFSPRENGRTIGMSEMTYYVALPLVAAGDGIAPGEAVECFNPNSAVMKAEVLSQRRLRRRDSMQSDRGSRGRRLRRRHGDPQFGPGAGGLIHTVRSIELATSDKALSERSVAPQIIACEFGVKHGKTESQLSWTRLLRQHCSKGVEGQ